MKIRTLVAAIALGAAALLPAHAAVVNNSNFGPLTGVITFDDFDGYVTAVPESVVVGNVGALSVSYQSGFDSVIGANNADLQSNGFWGAASPFLFGDFTHGQTNLLSFSVAGGGARGIGAFFNAVNAGSIFLAAWNGNTLLETHVFNVVTPSASYNEGAFRGFYREAGDINKFTVIGSGVAMDNLTLAPVPEPGTYAMLLAGLGLLGSIVSRRRKG